MTLANAFSTAWKDLKAVASKVANALTIHESAIETAVKDVSAIATAVVPAAAPVITAFDTIEEATMGAIAAAYQDVKNAPSLTAIFGDLEPGLKALISTLENHPTVTSTVAALNQVK